MVEINCSLLSSSSLFRFDWLINALCRVSKRRCSNQICWSWCFYRPNTGCLRCISLRLDKSLLLCFCMLMFITLYLDGGRVFDEWLGLVLLDLRIYVLIPIVLVDFGSPIESFIGIFTALVWSLSTTCRFRSFTIVCRWCILSSLNDYGGFVSSLSGVDQEVKLKKSSCLSGVIRIPRWLNLWVYMYL